ncbi:hypothetical protein [Brevibacillus laterosporus]|nr:hypothetical protein [Brevibacillus laterosporus]
MTKRPDKLASMTCDDFKEMNEVTKRERCDMPVRVAKLESEVKELRKLVHLMEPCMDYDKSPYGNYLWREVMGVVNGK